MLFFYNNNKKIHIHFPLIIKNKLINFHHLQYKKKKTKTIPFISKTHKKNPINKKLLLTPTLEKKSPKTI